MLSTRLDLASLSEHGKQAEDGHRQHTIRTTDGRTITVDLVLLCTGQTPNTGILRDFAPETVDEATGYAKVNRALQLVTVPVAKSDAEEVADKLNELDLDKSLTVQKSLYPHIFVIGDAADGFGAIKAGHNAYSQGEVAYKNIIKLIEGEEKNEQVELEHYEPAQPMIKVSLGLVSRFVRHLLRVRSPSIE